MALEPSDLYRSPNPLARDYARFQVAERLLLTGHSHQAWPDRGFEGQKQAWLDAAEHVDAKWPRAFEKAEAVRRGYARLLDDDERRIALAASTHDLLVRFLSGLPLRARPRLVTTGGEYHTIRRQLDRLAEEGIEVARVPAEPATSAAERAAAAVDSRTAAVLISAVFFRTGRIAPGLRAVQGACERHGALLLVDAYHALNAVPFSLKEEGLEQAYVTGGGYKYCQLGEGNAFLRFPEGCALRPVITGWFSEFETMADGEAAGAVAYGSGPYRFAGATYDPTSHYRAAAVFAYFDEKGLSPALLRAVSQHQVGLLARGFDALDADPALITRDRTAPIEELGGFLALSSPHAAAISRDLAVRGVFADARGDVLRLGPAPYLSDRQLEDAVEILGAAVRSLDASTRKVL